MEKRFDDINQSMNQRFLELGEDIREIRIMLLDFLKKEAA